MNCNKKQTINILLFLASMLISMFCAASTQDRGDIRKSIWVKNVVKDPITDLYNGKILREGAFVGGGPEPNPIIIFAFNNLDLFNSDEDLVPALANLPKPDLPFFSNRVEVTIRWDSEEPLKSVWDFREYRGGRYFAIPYNPYGFKRSLLEHDALFIRYKSKNGRDVTLFFSTGNLAEVLGEYSKNRKDDD